MLGFKQAIKSFFCRQRPQPEAPGKTEFQYAERFLFETMPFGDVLNLNIDDYLDVIWEVKVIHRRHVSVCGKYPKLSNVKVAPKRKACREPRGGLKKGGSSVPEDTCWTTIFDADVSMPTRFKPGYKAT